MKKKEHFMELEELFKDTKIKLWIADYKKKPNTQRIYLQGILAYTDYVKKSPTQIIEEAKADIRAGKLMDERIIFEEFTFFNEFLVNSGLAPKTIAGHVTGIKSFFTKFYIEVPHVRSDKKIKPLEKNKKVPSKEDLQTVLSVTSPLEKCLVLVGCTGGLSAEEVRNLTLEDYFSGYDKTDEICTLQLRRTKTDVDFITFLPMETTRAINAYLEYRERELKNNDVVKERSLKKQRITRNNKGEATGYLFISEHVPNIYNETKNEELRKISHNSYMKIFQQISNKAQKNTAYGDWNLIRSHNLRRYFYSALINGGADSFTVEFLAGHTIPESQWAYIVADPKKLKEQYQKYIPYLTIEKSLDISTSPEYINAIARAEKAEAEAVRVSVERNEIEKLREEIRIAKEEAANAKGDFDLLAQYYEGELKTIKQKFRRIEFLPDDGKEPENLEDFE